MRKLLKWTGVAIAVLLLLVAALFVQTWYFRPFSIDIFFERIFIQFALEEPELLTQLGLLRQTGYRGLDDELGDVSPAHSRSIAALEREGLETLRAYDRASLSPSQQLSYDVLESYLKDRVEGERWLYHDYPVNQLFGAQNETPNFMIQYHPLDDAVDARNYNTRLGDFSRKFAGLLEGLKLRESKGVVPPKFVIGRVLTEMRAFIAPAAKENVLYTHLRDRLAKLDSVPAVERTRFLDEAARQIEASVYPAYRSLIAFFEHLEQTVDEDYGVWKLPDGEAYSEGWALYAERLAWEMGFHKDPLDNLGRLQAEMMRAVRLVVDTGIHRKRWTREQAIDYMVEKTGMAHGEVTSEVERYFVDPGQALAYKVGMQKILDLRAHARRELGPKFDLRGFHGVVLGNGELPLSILEAEVNRWISRQQQGS